MGTKSANKVCPLAAKTFKFIGCKADDSSLFKPIASSLELSTCQALNL